MRSGLFARRTGLKSVRRLVVHAQNPLVFVDGGRCGVCSEYRGHGSTQGAVPGETAELVASVRAGTAPRTPLEFEPGPPTFIHRAHVHGLALNTR